MQMERVLVVGAGKWQVPIIEALRKEFAFVDAVDPYEDNAGSALVDNQIIEDIRNYDKIHELIKDIGYKLILSDQSDLGIETTTILSQRLGLKSNDLGAVNLFLKKHLSRDFASSIGIMVPRYKYSSNLDELIEFTSKADSPLIVKPSDSQSSRGIQKIYPDNEQEVKRAVSQAKEHSRNGITLVEEFIDGIELTAEGICIGGNHQTLAISLKKHFRTGIASELFYPADIPTEVRDQIVRMNDLFVNKSGIDTAITHAEYMVVPASNQVYLIEIACRGGGSLISSDIVPWLTGLDVYGQLIQNLLGIQDDLYSPIVNSRAAVLHFFEFEPGRVLAIRGLEEAKRIPGVHELRLSFKVGDYLQKAGDDSTRHGFVIIFAHSSTEARAILENVGRAIKIEVTKE